MLRTQKKYSFLTFLGRFLLPPLLILLSVLLFWIYHVSEKNIRNQQNLSIELNNKNAARELKRVQHYLLSALQETVLLLNGVVNSQEVIAEDTMMKVLQKGEDNQFDFLHFVPSSGDLEVAVSDSPFFDFRDSIDQFRDGAEFLLNSWHIIDVGLPGDQLWIMATGKRIIVRDTGLVLGTLVGGVVINDNQILAREILTSTNARYAALAVGQNIIAANIPLTLETLNVLGANRSTVSRAVLKEKGEQQAVLISRSSYPFASNSDLKILLVYQDSLYPEIRKIFLHSGGTALLFTVLLFVVFALFSRRQTEKAIGNLLHYTETAATKPGEVVYSPGPLLEFNRIGKAVEEMIGLLNTAADELKENKKRLELVIDGAGLSTWDWNVETGEMRYNERRAEMLGLSPDEVESHFTSWKECLHPDDKDMVLQRLTNHLDGKSPVFQSEHRLQSKSGKWIWVLDAGRVFKRDAAGNPLLAAGINLDISRQKEAERALLKERALLLSLINSIPDLIFYKDRESVYLGCNKAFERFTGQTEQEIIGKTDFDLFPKEEAEFYRKKDRVMLSSAVACRNEEQVTYPDGHQVLLDTMKTPLIGSDREIVGLIGVSRDITRLKEVEQRLAEERERLAVTLRSIGDGVITTDTGGRIVFLNKVAEELTGWTDEEVFGKDFVEVYDIINGKSGQKMIDPVSQVMANGKVSGDTGNTVLVSRGGTKRIIAESAAPIKDRANNIIGVVVVFRDVSNERRMEEELLKIRKIESIGVLAGGIAHDFNNILTAVLGNIELSSFRVARVDEKAEHFLAEAAKATKRAVKLTQQLLTFAKGGEPIRESTDLRILIQDTADFVTHGSQVLCEYDFPEELWRVDGDSGQISQVIQNIVLNAKYAMEEGGTIHIRCENVEKLDEISQTSSHKGGFVKIVIADSGKGIPEEMIDKIFDPYFTTKQTGSGLGLAISHSIIVKHRGVITVHSRLGEGTRFVIFLPAILGSDKDGGGENGGERSMVKSARILLMDDEQGVLDIVEAQLKSLGHKVIQVTEGSQAVEIYEKLQTEGTPVDMVIVDLTVPAGMGGRETAGQLLELDPEAKIVVASGYSNDPIMANYEGYGFKGAVSKPFGLAELSHVIHQILG